MPDFYPTNGFVFDAPKMIKEGLAGLTFEIGLVPLLILVNKLKGSSLLLLLRKGFVFSQNFRFFSVVQ